jgi:hypothetical protein
MPGVEFLVELPGEHVLTIGGVQRKWGHPRDTILILLPGPRVMVVALHRKPMKLPVAQNVIRYGHGGLNINACRNNGRWPTNVLLVHGPSCHMSCQPDCPVRIISQQSGHSTSKPHSGDGKPLDTRGTGWGFRRMPSNFNDSGTASRFFPQFANLDEAMAWLRQLTV